VPPLPQAPDPRRALRSLPASSATTEGDVTDKLPAGGGSNARNLAVKTGGGPYALLSTLEKWNFYRSRHFDRLSL
jgi:hypothetical protein